MAQSVNHVDSKKTKTGFVKWFCNHKGYGFLNENNIDGDIFVHHLDINSKGFRHLKKGQLVSFELLDSSKKKRAENINVLS